MMFWKVCQQRISCVRKTIANLYILPVPQKMSELTTEQAYYWSSLHIMERTP